MDPTSIMIAGAAGAPVLTLVGVFIFLQSRKKALQQLLQNPAEGNVSFPFEQSIQSIEEWQGRRLLSKKQKEYLHQHKEALSEMHICTRALVQPEHSAVREAEPLIHNARLDDLPRRISEMETLRDSMRYARQIPSEFFDSLHEDWQSRLEDEVLAYELIGVRKALVKRDYDTFRALIRQLQQAGIGAKKADFSVLFQLVETMARFDQLDFATSTSTALQSGIELVQRQESWFVKQVPEIWEQLQVCIKDWEARWLQKWAQEQQWSKILQLYINDPQKRADPQNDPVVMQAIETILQTGPHKEGELYLSMWISLKRRSQSLEGLEAPWVNTLSTKLQHFFVREASVHLQAVRLLGGWVSAPAYAKRLGDYLSIFKRFNVLVDQSEDAQVYPIAYAYWISGLKVETALAEYIDMKEELKLLQQSLENDSTAVLNRLCDEREKGTFSLLKFPSEKEELVVQIVEKFSREAMLQPPLVALEMLRKLARLFEEERIQRLFKQFVQAYLQSKNQYEVKDLRFVVEGLLRFPQDAYFIQQFKVIVYNFITEYLQEQGIFKDASRRSGGNTATKEAQRERLIRVKQSITLLADARQQSLKKIALPDLRAALEQLFEGLRSKVEIQFMAFSGQVRDDFDLTFDGFLRAGRSTVYSDRTNHPHFTRIGVLLAECMVALEGIIQQLAIKKRRR